MSERFQRSLAAIVAADVVGYSRLVGTDEEGTLAALRAVRRDVVAPLLADHGGRVANTAGDSLLIEFPSGVGAVRFALCLQRAMADRVAAGGALRFRVGVNVGDVVRDGEDLLGDGVNIAARLEAIAEPGGIALAEDAHRLLGENRDIRWRDGGVQRLKNIARPVRVFRWLPDDDAGSLAADGAGRGPAIGADKPSIAVLPFEPVGADPDQAIFCDGLTEDIITMLSKLDGLRVVARASSFALRDRQLDPRDAARELGVRHVLHGSVRKSGNRLRISAQLVDAADGSTLWAERYDRTMDDIFAIQDEITLVVATEMQVCLTDGEQARLRYVTTSNVAAWTLWAKGLAHLRSAVTREGMGPAREYWERALALDPDSAALNAMLGFMHALDARFGWWEERPVALGKARAYAERALDLDQKNADAHMALSLAGLFEGRFDEAVTAARRAVALAPGSADTADVASFVLTPCGFPDEAIALSRRAMSLSPHHPPVYFGQLGNACHHAGRIEEAIAAFEQYEARSPGFGLVDLVIIHQQSGRAEEARACARRLLDARPGFTVEAWSRTQFRRDQERLARDLDALREAGVPSG
ncbi:tetratricopeptide repeat protein [Limibaculum sp. M0105]|uniref:Tetratricopeptide repeat protein n=1 Tax=Thermohalobaculum xanthum TaxID=2753746 RepID=A0A8J7M3R6_9RHOB|nr:adenylate/guanylate cyclase domain-containing protein [Thermohalobaculum xanthum]MBK0397593.1 tetratricopeptide repeat protein [Thermohalobaculum xanthum]